MRKLLSTFLAAALAVGAQATTTLTQYGITWTWSEDLTTGTFANGDYYVVAPSGLTLIGITGTNDDAVVRASLSGVSTSSGTQTINGSMANPIPDEYPPQGLDSRYSNYTESLNIGRSGGSPLSGGNTRSIAAGTSIVTVSSMLSAGGDKEQSRDHAVLTVLSSAPAAGSFRPSPYGTDKTISWNKSDLDYTILKNLTPVTGQSSPTSSAFTRPWLHVSVGYLESWAMSPRNNQPGYDRDMGYAIQNAYLELHQNYSDATKELAYVRLVQAGIDIYGALKYGQYSSGFYDALAGNYCFHSLVVLAGLALDDTDIKFYANDANRITNPYIPGTPSRFNEDIITSAVTSGMVNDTVPDAYMTEDRPRYTYTAQMLDMPEWGAENGAIPSTLGAGSNVGVIYRNVRYPGIVGAVLAVQLTTGGVELWNHQAFFDYFDRAKAFYLGSGDDSTPSTVALAWAAYRSLGGAIWTGVPISGVAWIPPSGDRMIIEYTDQVTTGAGGNGGVTLTMSGGAVTATYSEVLLPKDKTGANRALQPWQRVYSLSRAIGSVETLGTYSYTQPSNGVEAAAGGVDVESVTNAPIQNYVGLGSVETEGGGGRSSGGDTTAPTPNPATISGTPSHTSSTITLTATTATDETALHATPYAHSSDDGASWTAYQSSAAYTFTGLTASTTYQCRVRARDAAGNVTTQSAATAVTTDTIQASSNRRSISSILGGSF